MDRCSPQPPDESPLLAPIAGVSIELFVTVSRRLVRFQFDAGHAVDIAGELGVPPADWDAAAAGWTDRLRASPLVSAEFARLYRDPGNST
jgi:hypothetical protein